MLCQNGINPIECCRGGEKMIYCNTISDQGDKEWYAVYTVVRHEKSVNLALAERNIETFLPVREVVSQWTDRKKKVHLSLFPGYLFVSISLRDKYLDVLNTRGVVRVLGTNGVPSPVPLEQVDAVRRLLKSNVKYDPYPYFTQGKEVVVINGPFEGIRGRISGRRGEYRLILSVDIIRRSVAVEVDIKDVDLD